MRPDRPPRPVAGLMLPEPGDVAKAWLVGLVADAPLERGAALPGERFAREAPVLCAAVLDALGSDAPSPAGAVLAELAGARSAAEAVAAAEVLRRAVASCLGEEDRAAAAGRLAHVCSLLAQRAVAVPATADEAIAAALAAGRPFALLAVEIDDAERLLAAHDAGDAFAAVERVLPGAIPGTPGRWWIVDPPHDARALADRLGAEIAGAASLGGVPLRAAIGIAHAPGDGATPAELMARADEGVFAARALGRPVA